MSTCKCNYKQNFLYFIRRNHIQSILHPSWSYFDKKVFRLSSCQPPCPMFMETHSLWKAKWRNFLLYAISYSTYMSHVPYNNHFAEVLLYGSSAPLNRWNFHLAIIQGDLFKLKTPKGLVVPFTVKLFRHMYVELSVTSSGLKIFLKH